MLFVLGNSPVLSVVLFFLHNMEPDEFSNSIKGDGITAELTKPVTPPADPVSKDNGPIATSDVQVSVPEVPVPNEAPVVTVDESIPSNTTPMNNDSTGNPEDNSAVGGGKASRRGSVESLSSVCSDGESVGTASMDGDGDLLLPLETPKEKFDIGLDEIDLIVKNRKVKISTLIPRAKHEHGRRVRMALISQEDFNLVLGEVMGTTFPNPDGTPSYDRPEFLVQVISNFTPANKVDPLSNLLNLKHETVENESEAAGGGEGVSSRAISPEPHGIADAEGEEEDDEDEDEEDEARGSPVHFAAGSAGERTDEEGRSTSSAPNAVSKGTPPANDGSPHKEGDTKPPRDQKKAPEKMATPKQHKPKKLIKKGTKGKKSKGGAGAVEEEDHLVTVLFDRVKCLYILSPKCSEELFVKLRAQRVKLNRALEQDEAGRLGLKVKQARGMLVRSNSMISQLPNCVPTSPTGSPSKAAGTEEEGGQKVPASVPIGTKIAIEHQHMSPRDDETLTLASTAATATAPLPVFPSIDYSKPDAATGVYYIPHTKNSLSLSLPPIAPMPMPTNTPLLHIQQSYWCTGDRKIECCNMEMQRIFQRFLRVFLIPQLDDEQFMTKLLKKLAKVSRRNQAYCTRGL